MNDDLRRVVVSLVNDRICRERLGYSVDRCIHERILPCTLRLCDDFKERMLVLHRARMSLGDVKVHYPASETFWVLKFDPDFLRYSLLKYTQFTVDRLAAPGEHGWRAQHRGKSTSVQYFIYMDVSIVEHMYMLPPHSGQVQVPHMCVFHLYHAEPRVVFHGLQLRHCETSEEGEQKLVF